MPIFEYKCQECGCKMQFLEKSSAKTKHTCPDCSSKNVKKILSGFSVGKAGPESHSSCSTGACSTGSCPTGSCPFA